MRKRGSLPRNQQEEQTARVGTLVVEVEKMKSELFEAEKSLPQHEELASKWSGSCATHRDSSCPKRNRESVRWRRSSKCRKHFVKERKLQQQQQHQ